MESNGKTKKHVEEILDKISKKLEVTFSVYNEEVSFSHVQPYIQDVKNREKISKEDVEILKERFATLLDEKEETKKYSKTLIETICELETNFNKAYDSYLFCVQQTNFVPYVIQAKKEKKDFDKNFRILKIVGKNLAPQEKEQKPVKTRKI